MKTKNLFPCLGVALMRSRACLGKALMRSRVLFALIAVLNLIPAGRVTAQTFTILHSFAATSPVPQKNAPLSQMRGPNCLIV